MKRNISLAAVFVLLLSLPSYAGSAPSCVKGTLASYIALGAGGCTFNGALYHNFTYAALSTVGIPPGQITVTPFPGPVVSAAYFPGLNFSASWSAAAGKSERSVIGYDVTPYPATVGPVSSAVLTLDLGTVKVNGIIGSATVQETVNAGTLSAALQVHEKCEEVCSIKQKDQVIIAYNTTTTLQVLVNVTLSGGTNGVSLKLFANDFNFCPECAEPQ